MRFLKLILLSFPVLVFSCQVPAYSPDKEEEIGQKKVSFSINNPKEGDDLVAIQIYSHDKDNVKRAYGYGLFDSYDIPSISLVNNQQYSFAITTVSNAQSIIAHEYSEYGVEYYAPFSVNIARPLLVGNDFMVSTKYFRYISSGIAILQDGDKTVTYDHPQIERYVGYSPKFDLGDENHISLDLKRVYGALRLTAINLEGGQLIFNFEGSSSVVLDSDNSETTINMSLSGSSGDEMEWIKDDYSEKIRYSVLYIASNGQAYPLGDDRELDLVRAKVQPIEVTIHSHADVAMTLESGKLEELPPIGLDIELF